MHNNYVYIMPVIVAFHGVNLHGCLWIDMDSDWLGVGFGYEWLDWVVRVQSVTWAAIASCPCDW